MAKHSNPALALPVISLRRPASLEYFIIRESHQYIIADSSISEQVLGNFFRIVAAQFAFAASASYKIAVVIGLFHNPAVASAKNSALLRRCS